MADHQSYVFYDFMTQTQHHPHHLLPSATHVTAAPPASAYVKAASNNPTTPKMFRCQFCTRKFYSSQALGGHQNGHKKEHATARHHSYFSFQVASAATAVLNDSPPPTPSSSSGYDHPYNFNPGLLYHQKQLSPPPFPSSASASALDHSTFLNPYNSPATSASSDSAEVDLSLRL